jgi:hypothetical protein
MLPEKVITTSPVPSPGGEAQAGDGGERREAVGCRERDEQIGSARIGIGNGDLIAVGGGKDEGVSSLVDCAAGGSVFTGGSLWRSR